MTAPMTREEFMEQINHLVDQAIADGMCATGTDEYLENSILDELETTPLPETTSTLLIALLTVFGVRRREFLACHPAH